MCCLFGFIDYAGALSVTQKSCLIRELSIAAEVRGTDATGIAYNTSRGLQIYKRPLVDQHFRVLLIIDIQVKLEFVVSANVNISIGMTYWYKNAKEYVFCVRVKERTATNDTIDLVEEQYEFTAYAMGTLGIKAGVRLTVRVGLLSTSIASVGISADVGG